MNDNNNGIIIETHDLKKHYKGHSIRALDGVSMQVRRGEVVVIVGPSGSGKSTFLRSLNLLELPTEGSITFEGQVITNPKTDINRHRQKMGMVFQQFNLFNNLNIIDNITLAPIKLLKMSKADAEKKAMELLERIGLADKAQVYPQQLSGGQKQRVAIVRALAMEPEVMLFDEPTSALDPIATKHIEELLLQLQKEVTILIVTHNMGQAKRISSKSMFMYLGELVEYGDTETMFSKPSDERTKAYLTGKMG